MKQSVHGRYKNKKLRENIKRVSNQSTFDTSTWGGGAKGHNEEESKGWELPHGSDQVRNPRLRPPNKLDEGIWSNTPTR